MQKLIYRLSWRGQFKQTPCICINSRYTSNAKDTNPETAMSSRNEAPDIYSAFRRETAHLQNITFCCMSHLLIPLMSFSFIHYVCYLVHCAQIYIMILMH